MSYSLGPLGEDSVGSLEIPLAPGLEVCRFCHGERRGEACEKVAMVLAIGHTLRAHQALGCPDALPSFLEVVHRLFEDDVLICHDRSIRAGLVRSPDYCVFTRELPYQRREVAGCVPCYVPRVLWAHLRQPNPLPGNR
jgi:hypothetical protein